MKEYVTLSRFMDVFRNMGREDSFTYDGFKALYEYLIECEESGGGELELDPIAYDCDFAEYSDLEEFQEDYGKEDYPDMDSVHNATTVISISDDAFIIHNF